MPQFTDRTDRSGLTTTMRLIRVPGGPGITAVATSIKLTCCPVHWWQGRTTPHEEGYCEPCDNGRSYSWKAYTGCWLPKTGEHVILEVTARTSEYFEQYVDRYGSLRGCHFQAIRIGGRPTARCSVRCKPADLTGIELPECRNLQNILMNIWGYKEDGTLTEKRRRLSESANPTNGLPRLTPQEIIDAAQANEAGARSNGNGHPTKPTNPK